MRLSLKPLTIRTAQVIHLMSRGLCLEWIVSMWPACSEEENNTIMDGHYLSTERGKGGGWKHFGCVAIKIYFIPP